MLSTRHQAYKHICEGKSDYLSNNNKNRPANRPQNSLALRCRPSAEKVMPECVPLTRKMLKNPIEIRVRVRSIFHRPSTWRGKKRGRSAASLCSWPGSTGPGALFLPTSPAAGRTNLPGSPTPNPGAAISSSPSMIWIMSSCFEVQQTEAGAGVGPEARSPKNR